MAILDNFFRHKILDDMTKRKIERKVDIIFKDIRRAQTPEEVVPLLVELSEFIDRENLTEQQLEELKGIGSRAMSRHSRMEFLNNFGALLSIVTSSMIAGGAITGMYAMFTAGILTPLTAVLLLPLALLPVYLFYYGKARRWFS